MAKLKILIVDDEPDICEVLEESISSDNAAIKTANSAREAMEMLTAEHFDIMVTDVKMAEEDGLSLAKKAISHSSSLLVIFITGFGDKDIAIQAVKSGAFDFLEKPIDPDVFNSAIIRAEKFVTMKWELAESQMRMEQTHKLASVGEIAASVLHEINTPLTIVLGEAEELQFQLAEVPGLDKEVMASVDAILLAGKRIEIISKGLKVLSHKNVLDDRKPIAIQEVIDSTFPLLKKKILAKEIQMRRPPFNQQLRAFGSAVGLSQVIVNLVNNACDAIEMKLEKWIEIRVDEAPEQMTIRVIDSGPGIPIEQHARLLEAFYTTKALGKGTGLGLSISKRIVEEHGGQFGIDGTCANTCFYMTLPIFRENL